MLCRHIYVTDMNHKSSKYFKITHEIFLLIGYKI